MFKKYKMITNCEILDEDWKTQLGLGYPCIPENSIVEVIGHYTNMNGTFAKVLWNGRVYYTTFKKLRKVD